MNSVPSLLAVLNFFGQEGNQLRRSRRCWHIANPASALSTINQALRDVQTYEEAIPDREKEVGARRH